MQQFKANAKQIGITAIVSGVVQALVPLFGDGDKVFRSIVGLNT